jgi:hypothetical protein
VDGGVAAVARPFNRVTFIGENRVIAHTHILSPLGRARKCIGDADMRQSGLGKIIVGNAVHFVPTCPPNAPDSALVVRNSASTLILSPHRFIVPQTVTSVKRKGAPCRGEGETPPGALNFAYLEWFWTPLAFGHV